jgi:hypothetical protein
LTELSIRILLFVLLLFFFNVMIVLFYSSCACWILLPVLLLLLDIYSYLDGGCNAEYHIGHSAVPMSADHIYYCMAVEVYFLCLG